MKKVFVTFIEVLILGSGIVSCSFINNNSPEEIQLFKEVSFSYDILKDVADSINCRSIINKKNTPILAIYADSACYIVNPTKKMLANFSHDKKYFNGMRFYKFPLLDSVSFHMETHTELFDTTGVTEGKPIVRCSSFSVSKKIIPELKDLSDWIPMFIHEMIHGFEDMHSEYCTVRRGYNWPLSPNDFIYLPQENDWLLNSLEIENRTLVDAVMASSEIERNEKLKLFKQQRKKRKQKNQRRLITHGKSIQKEKIAIRL